MLMKKSDDDTLFKKRWIFINAITKTLHWAKSHETANQSKCMLLTSVAPVTVSASSTNGTYSIRVDLHSAAASNASVGEGGLVISELSESLASNFKSVIQCISGRS